jgi:AcrR family transcriptional regulator
LSGELPVTSPTVDVTAAEAMEARAIEAMLACVARHGLSKTTLDDVAREAGCARATLYRYFGGKAPLIAAVLCSERDRIAATLRDAAAAETTIEDVVVAVMTTAAREFAAHGALQFVLTFEPEVVLPFVTFAAGDAFLGDVGRLIAPCLAPYLADDRRARAGEWIARTTLAYSIAHNSPFRLTDHDDVHALVHEFLLPGLSGRVPTAASSASSSRG